MDKYVSDCCGAEPYQSLEGWVQNLKIRCGECGEVCEVVKKNEVMENG